MKVLVAIPTYNCAPQIGRVLAGFDKQLLDRVNKVVVIDNQSKDDTISAALEAAKKNGGPKIEVWRNDHNYNLGGTHKVAFLAGERLGYDYVVILHGDNQAKTAELGNLLDIAERHPEADAVLGTRFMKGSRLIGYSWKRIWGNRAINLIYSLVALRSSRDLGSGLNLFKLTSLSDHQFLQFGNTITFNIDLLLSYFSKHDKLIYTPITWTEEDQVTNARNLKVGSTAVKKLFAWRFGNSKPIETQPAEYYKSTRQY